MRLLDEQYTRTPFYGVLKMTAWLRENGHPVNCKRVRRLLRLMGLEAIYPKPRLSLVTPGHQIYPYLLRGVKVTRVNQVWSADITYVRLLGGFVYLVAIIDWYSRYVLSWEVSTTMESEFCLSALNRSLQVAKPEIFNTDQGRSSQAMRSLEFSKSARSPSAWMGEVEHWTTSSSNGSGAASNTKRSTCEIIRPRRRPLQAWENTSSSTTESGFISRSTTKLRRPFTGCPLENKTSVD